VLDKKAVLVTLYAHFFMVDSVLLFFFFCVVVFCCFVLLVFVFCLFLFFCLCICVLCPMLPVSLDCPVFIAPSVFSNVYLVT